MKPHRTLVLAALVALAFALVPARPGAAQMEQTVSRGGREVVVVVEGLRNDRGELVGGLYENAATWLVADHAAEDCHALIRHGRARCTFHPTTRSVAFAALHDEDGDGELDRDFIGLPSEGYAFSNDVREPFGPPSFDAASFSAVRATPFVVHVRYGI